MKKKKKSYMCDIVIGRIWSGIQNVIDDFYPETPTN